MQIKQLARDARSTYRNLKKVKISNVRNEIKGDPKKIKLVGFVKCFNEGRSGNLERCLKHLSSFCDDIVICDDSSQDNSLEIAKKYTNHIIVMPDEFRQELAHKQKLLELALSLDPDWIVFLDPDEIFDREGELGGIRSLCVYGDEHDIDSFSFQYHNLWKDRDSFRVDELWYKNWQPKLWKKKDNLRFDIREGLHLRQYPLGLNSDRRTDIRLIHYGFASPDKIEKKYSTYQNLGQTGRALQRIKDEKGIILKAFSRDWLPPSTFKITVVCLIYKSIGYAKFVQESFYKYTRDADSNVDFLFIANDPTDKLVSYLKENSIPNLIFRNEDQNEYYLKRVYRAWNYGGTNANGDIVVFVNSDMAFSEGWLDNLIRNLTNDRIVTSRLVESGKLRSGKYGIEMNFGRTYSEFRDSEFQQFAEETSTSVLKSGGLFMPCAIYKDTFVKSGGYPIGNRTEKDGSITPGDKIFFYETLHALGIRHYTVFDSIVYHVQEGEMDS